MKKYSFVFLLLLSDISAAGEWRGNAVVDYHWFVNEGSFPGQQKTYLSAAIEPEYLFDWNDGYDLFSFKGFYRQDQYDDARTRGDLRELSWLHVGEDWEITVGVSKVFWGVTESLHLIDVINQSDTVENLDGEDKLGQAMINVTFIRDWGVVSAFVLPGFRERTFPGVNGRPRFGIEIDTGLSVYQSSDADRHIDYALRYTHSIDDWDIGVAYFTGTSREPRFVPNFNTTMQLVSVSPLYEQIKQTSVDLQASIGSWLWKLEAINRSGQGKTFTAAAGGFEYTFVGIFESDMDIGMIAEYLYDGRDDTVITSPFSSSPFQNDLVLGARLTFNDVQSTEILASIIEDLDGSGRTYNIEASRRLGDAWILSIEARGVSGVAPATTLASFSRDNRLRTELAYYF
jgi:hypothetical protein